MKIFENNLEELLKLAEAATQNNDLPKAIKLWQKIIRKFPNTSPPESWLWLSRCYVDLGKLDRAERAVSAGIKKHPDQSKLLIMSGKIASANEDWKRAIRRWTKVIEKLGDKAPPISWTNLARAQRRSGQLKLAEDSANQGLTKHADDLDILIELAEIATAKKDWPVAMDFWTKTMAAITQATTHNVSVKQNIRLNLSIIKRLIDIEDYKAKIKKYSSSKTKRKIAIVTSMTKGYDALKPPEIIDDRFDYIVYTNDNVKDVGIFDIRPLPFPKLDDARAIRYVKTHPHTLMSEYDVVVWADSSLMIVGDIYPLIKDFLDSKKAIGSGVHPLRKNIYEEIDANIALHKEDPKIMQKQIQHYKKAGFKHNDLSENTLLMFNLKNEKLAPALETWWDEICRWSRRDQLSFNYSLAQNGVDWFRLTRPPQDIRNHPDFVMTMHHTNPPVLQELMNQLTQLPI